MDKKDFAINQHSAEPEYEPLFDPVEYVGSYALVDLIEEEEHSKVYFTTNSLTGEKMVIKVFDKSDTLYKQYTPDLIIWQAVNFSSIVPIATIIDEPTKYAYVVPYYAGGDLYFAIQENLKLTLDAATCIMWDLVTAVNYLHQNGIVHGNICLENIMLKEKDQLLDPHAILCGITRARRGEIPISIIPDFEKDIYTDPSLGTTLNYSTDIFALGTVFYFLSNCFETKEQVEAEDEAQFSKFKDLLNRMLDKDPSRRCRINDVLCHEFFAMHTERIGKTRQFVHFNGVMTHVCQVIDEGVDFIGRFEPVVEDQEFYFI